MSKTQTSDEISRFHNWCRLAYCLNKPVKNALLAILHNTISHPSINGLPSDPKDLYIYLYSRRKELMKSSLRGPQLAQLLPTSSQEVNSASFDITLIKALLRKFARITNKDGTWNAPRPSDHSIAAAIYRAGDIRNRVFHHSDPSALDEKDFKDMWVEIERALDDLHYKGNIREFYDMTIDPTIEADLIKSHANMEKDFEEIQRRYKDDCKQKKDESKNFVERQYKVSNSNRIIRRLLDIGQILESNSSVLVKGNPGLGKTFSAKKLRSLWAEDKIFHQKNLLYIDSKDVERERKDFKSKFAAPICVSQLYYSLEYNTDGYLESFGRRHLTSRDDYIVVIDGLDELEIGETDLDEAFVINLQKKIDMDFSLSAMETIMAIYLGKFCKGSKVIVFGREDAVNRLIGFHDRLKGLHGRLAPSVESQAVLDLMELDEIGMKTLISLNTSDETSRATFDIFRDQNLAKNPSYLIAMLKMRGYLQNQDIGNITEAKIFMIDILDFFKKCAPTPQHQDIQIFEGLLELDEMQEYIECIQNIAKISYLSLLEEKIKIEVEEWTDGGVGYFKYTPSNRYEDGQAIKVKSEILKKLDYFYVRHRGSRVLLEPIHTLKMEFLVACYILSHREEWKKFKKLKADRQAPIKSFIPSFLIRDCLTKVFVQKVLKPDTIEDALLEIMPHIF